MHPAHRQAKREGNHGRQGHHHLRRHRVDAHADHVPPPADHAGRDRASSRSRRPRPAPRSSTCMRAIPRTAGRRPDPDVFMQFLPRIKQTTDAVINITTGGGLGMTLEERLAAPLRAKPEMCFAQHGLDELRHLPCWRPRKTWKHDWEQPYVEGPRTSSSATPSREIERHPRSLGKAHGTRFEFECYDIGHLYNLATSSTRGSSSRRSSCRRSSASWAASAPTRGT